MRINTSILSILSATIPLSISCPFHAASEDPHNAASVRRNVPAPQSKTAITNVRVFDGSCFTPPQTIFISNGLITRNSSSITDTIDATGKYLIPGLIDAHVHITSMEGLENATSYGMTTAFNMACTNYTICMPLKQQPGLTDFLTAGLPAVGPNSAHAATKDPRASLKVTDLSNATDLASWAVGNGSDWFKITLELNGPSYNITQRLKKEVHALGQQIMSHATAISSYMQAIETNMDGIQHIPDDGNLTSAAINTLVASHRKNGQFATPTLSVFAFALNPPNPLMLATMRGNADPGNSSWNNVLHNAREMYRAGVPLLTGTDAIGPLAVNVTFAFGDTLHRELQYFVEDVGMSNAEAINAATKVAARSHRLRDRGSVKEGLRADLVLLNSDPLVDIKNTRDIEAVWVEGRQFTGEVAKKSG